MSLNLGLGFSEFNLKMGKPSVQRIYEFGDFRLDGAHLMLSRGDTELRLSPKAVEILLALVERRGEIVSKDELLEAVWPDTAVEESNLFLYLSILRKTLGTQPDGQPYLETLRRRGYRFSRDVRLLPAAENGERTSLLPRHLVSSDSSALVDHTPDRSDSVPGESRSRHLKRPAYIAAGSIAILTALAFGYWSFLSPRPIRSIAVMPFANENAELEYISDGMTDNLIGSLLAIPDLEVKSSSTMFRYKRTNTDAATVGKELNVEAVLSSRFVQRGEDLTLYLELVDPRTENSLWQQTYNGKTSHLGPLERDVVRDVVRELSVDLTDATRQRIAKNYTDSAEANRLFMKGRFLIRKLNEAKIREGLAYLRQATEHDPSYAPAFAMIAAGLRSLTLCCDVPPSELLEARRAATRAIELDENLAEAHSALASVLYQVDWNFAEAEKHYLRAVEIDPNSAVSHFLYADFLGRTGRTDEAKARRTRAMELEPYSPYFNAFALNSVDPNTALEQIQRTIDLDPDFYFSHFMAAGVYARLKMYPEAEAAYRRAKELAPEQTWTDVGLSRMLRERGEIDQARAVLDEMLSRSQSRYVPPFHIALAFKGLGDNDQALAWLEKAYQVRDPKMTFLKTTNWKAFEDDPRFQDIYRRVGF